MMDTVPLIASGYDWYCPECGHDNIVIEYKHGAMVHCAKCKSCFETDPPDHAFA